MKMDHKERGIFSPPPRRGYISPQILPSNSTINLSNSLNKGLTKSSTSMRASLFYSRSTSRGGNGPLKGRLSLREDLRVKMRLLNQGWDIVQELNGGGRFIMKRRA
jgi:hypothetical protein